MAKKKFNISSTLHKNKAEEPQLAEKIPLRKSPKDIEEVKEKVDNIHNAGTEQEKSKPKKRTSPRKSSAKSNAKTPENQKLVRLTIDTPEEMHKKLKVQSVLSGISMRDYILQLLEKELRKVKI